MIRIRPSEERGHIDHGWLDARHSFSFGEYFDPRHDGFRSLRVLNEDRVAPGHGFPMHPHRDMEILTWVLAGAIEHRDSMGNAGVIRAGEMQRMTAGAGVTHSEANPSASERLHLLQIWILPERRGLRPEYEQRAVRPEDLRDRLCLLASRDGAEGSLRIHQDARVYAAALAPGRSVALELAAGRYGWVQVARGAGSVNGVVLAAGDGAAIEGESKLEIVSAPGAELLVFDLA